MKRYNPSEIEPKWRDIWDEQEVYKADLASNKPKYYAMSMFNYPSGAGIHIGHAMNYTISDVMARYKRQAGYESFHPVGWDSFGLPAENFAIKTGISPQESIAKIIPDYHAQYKAMGWSNDWSREIATSDPRYYKWTQWIFAQVYKAGLAYQDARQQWWCTKCQTVLSNEQVIDGKCWRHDGADDPLVEKKEVKQWFFKITDYANAMLEATDALDWTQSVKLAQKNWIGKSQGAEIDFVVEGKKDPITVFTTRPDTVFGASFIVVAPEHDMVAALCTAKTKDAVNEYVKQALKKTELERQSDNKDKTGIFTGSHAINPATGDKIPVWVADYVLDGYGTGAIMAVPAHDERDLAFAEKFNLPVIQVVAPQLLDQKNPPREDKEDTKRNVVMCVIQHPTDDSYVTLRWKKFDWHNFVMGGVEGDESLESAARREIQEETGFTDLEYVDTLPLTMNSAFYAAHKDVNRNINTTVLKFKLLSLDTVETQKEVHEDFETDWTTADELHKLHPVSELDYILKWLRGEKILHTGEGVLVNSGIFNGMPTSDAREEIVAWLEQQHIGKSKTIFKIRDWSVSRQRYWGAPIPIIHCEKCGEQLVPDDQLPVVLPVLDDFAPSGDGRGALARATDWLQVDCPSCGGSAMRETDTLDTYMCSSWYFLRYLDPENTEAVFDKRTIDQWMPVDFYNGADHATAHMIYARFITRFLADQGYLNDPEPFKKFLFNGKVTAQNGEMFSKSKGNGIDPLEIISQGYGADALRTYLMFAAPVDTWVKWDPQGVPATHRFLNRIWNLVQEFVESDDDGNNETVLRIIHPTIKKVTHDLEHQKYNTAIAAMMEATNKLYAEKAAHHFAGKNNWQFALESLVALVAPFAPHAADELWQQLGKHTSVQRDSWPEWDEKYLVSETMEIVVQVNGKVRTTLELAKDTSKDDVESAALSDEKIAGLVGDKKPTKFIYVPGRLINIVT